MIAPQDFIQLTPDTVVSTNAIRSVTTDGHRLFVSTDQVTFEIDFLTDEECAHAMKTVINYLNIVETL